MNLPTSKNSPIGCTGIQPNLITCSKNVQRGKLSRGTGTLRHFFFSQSLYLLAIRGEQVSQQCRASKEALIKHVLIGLVLWDLLVERSYWFKIFAGILLVRFFCLKSLYSTGEITHYHQNKVLFSPVTGKGHHCGLMSLCSVVANVVVKFSRPVSKPMINADVHIAFSPDVLTSSWNQVAINFKLLWLFHPISPSCILTKLSYPIDKV